MIFRIQFFSFRDSDATITIKKWRASSKEGRETSDPNDAACKRLLRKEQSELTLLSSAGRDISVRNMTSRSTWKRENAITVAGVVVAVVIAPRDGGCNGQGPPQEGYRG